MDQATGRATEQAPEQAPGRQARTVMRAPDLGWRLRWAGVGAVVALLLVGLTWLLASVIRSPQDVLAEASAPPPSQITFPVVKQALDPSVEATGTLDHDVTVTGMLPVEDRDAAESAPRVTVTLPSGPVPGRLVRVAADGAFTIRLNTRVQDAEGTTVRIRFAAAQTATESLVVPTSALFTAADGQVAVIIVDAEGVEHQVTVTMGTQADGFVAITPAEPGQVEEGDLVLVSEPDS